MSVGLMSEKTTVVSVASERRVRQWYPGRVIEMGWYAVRGREIVDGPYNYYSSARGVAEFERKRARQR